MEDTGTVTMQRGSANARHVCCSGAVQDRGREASGCMQGWQERVERAGISGLPACGKARAKPGAEDSLQHPTSCILNCTFVWQPSYTQQQVPSMLRIDVIMLVLARA